MATTFDVISLGVHADMDTSEGNPDAENGAALEGLTIGSAGDPLHGHVQSFSPGSTGYAGGYSSSVYDPFVATDTFSIDGGADQTHDMTMGYDVTLTYTDSTTATARLTIFQDDAGNTYLAPETSFNADQAALEAKPIESITFDTAVFNGQNHGWPLTADRYDGSFATPGPVDGTSGDDVMTVGYTDGDGDIIGSGSDTIHGGAGHDTIDGGAGNDTIAGGTGNDSIAGGAGGDVITGGTGNDTLIGDQGADTLSGGDGSDTIYAGSADNPEAAPNMVGYWNFASYSTPEDDLAAPGNDMSFEGGAGVASGSGELALDGNGDYGIIADDPAFDLDAATVTMGFTLDSLTSLTGLFGKDAYDNAVGDFSVWVEADGRVVVRWQDDDDSFYIRSDTGTITAGTEHSVQVTLDNDTGTIELFVDGTLEGSTTAPGVTLDGNQNPWVVGGRGWGSTRGTADKVINELDGTITSFAIYDSALTPAEVADPAGDADVIQGGAGDDRIHGDTGDDILSGGDGADTVYLYDFFGDDTISGGEGGDDDDWIDAGGVSMPLTLVYTGAESGTISDGTNTATFSQVEAVETGSDADIVDATGAGSAGVRIYTGFGDDTVTGSAGDDWISTGKGNDEVHAGDGADTINSDYGDDVVWAGAGADTVWAGFGRDEIHGEAGDDYIYGGYGNDTIFGGDGDDEIGVGRNDNFADGGSGSDRFFFGHDMGSNVIVGGESGTDADILDFTGLYNAPITVAFTGDEAGTATDPYGDITFTEIEVIWGSDFDDVVDAAADGTGIEMFGYAGADTLTGGSGDDTIAGGAGDDVLKGNLGDDTFTFEGGFGDDTVSGGEKGEVAGDTLDASAVTAPLSVSFAGTDVGTLTDGTDTVAFSEIENLTLGSGADFVSAGGDTDGVGVVAGAGDDTIWGGTGDDTFLGGAGDDEIFGDAGADRIEGGDGADDLGGNAGDDTIFGGAGDDWVQGNEGANQLSGEAGDDTFEILTGAGGSDVISGGETGETAGDTLTFTGAHGANVKLTGDEAGAYKAGSASGTFAGIERVELTGQADAFDGSASAAGIAVDAGAGDDMLTGGTGDDALAGGAGNDTIYGGAGADTIIGGAGGDFIYTEAGDDVVYGGDDLDVIFAGEGNDTLHGDGGDDIFIVNGADASTTEVAGGETGETTGDTLILSGDGSSGSAVDVAFTGDEAGSFDDGTNSGSFTGIERVMTSGGDDTIDASAATAGTDLSAGSGADSVSGGAGADTIDAGSGDDTIAGGSGDDVVTGGYGDDTFAFSNGDGADIITDFDLADDDLDGFTNDQFDLSALTGADGNPVDIWDVVVSDTAGDGSGDAVLTFPNGESLTLTGVDPGTLDAARMQAMGIPCLAAGTLVDTPDGGRPVEQIKPGDRVTTKGGGAQPVVWTASRRLDAAALAAAPRLRPVRIRAGALGNWRDLLVSPQHRIALGTAGAPTGFVPACWLAADGDGRFRLALGRREVCYVHLLLPAHALIRAEGAWVESFYPGPQGLAALDPAARADLFRRVPSLAGIRTKPDAHRAYGPLALKEIRRRDLARFLERPARAGARGHIAGAARTPAPPRPGPGLL